MCITATQKIAHYSVNFNLIHKLFHTVSCLIVAQYLEKFQGHSICGYAGRRG